MVSNKAATLFKVKKPTLEGTCTPCDFLDTSDCLYPFPSDYFTIADASTDTGRRVHFTNASMPRNNAGVVVQSGDYNWNDGFSLGATMLTRVPNVDLGVTGARADHGHRSSPWLRARPSWWSTPRPSPIT